MLRGSVDNKYQYLKVVVEEKSHEKLERQLLKYISKYFDETSMHKNLLGGANLAGTLDTVMEDENELLDQSMVSDVSTTEMSSQD